MTMTPTEMDERSERLRSTATDMKEAGEEVDGAAVGTWAVIWAVTAVTCERLDRIIELLELGKGEGDGEQSR